MTAMPGPPAMPESPVVRLRLDLSYDGSAFHGWARQPGLRTVQQTVEDALGRVLALPAAPRLTVAGRTDAGVHARGQAAHLDVPEGCWQPAAATAARRLGRLLPADVRVHGIASAPAGFDARFSALWRRYSYRVCDDPARADPLRRHDTLWHPRPLDLRQMNEAAAGLPRRARLRRLLPPAARRDDRPGTAAARLGQAGSGRGGRDRRGRRVLPQHGAGADRRAAGGWRRQQAGLACGGAGRPDARSSRSGSAPAWALPGRNRLPGSG